MSLGEYIATIITFIGVPLIFIGVPIFVLTGGIDKFALRPLQRAYVGFETHADAKPGDVSFVYHTYRGFLLWFVQNEHRVHAPPDDALIILKRLLRFNLTWGMMSYGLLFVPPLAIGNYYAQKRSIESQRRAWSESDVQILGPDEPA